jgi:hypothetical protein
MWGSAFTHTRDALDMAKEGKKILGFKSLIILKKKPSR